jgi:hypothetical protein
MKIGKIGTGGVMGMNSKMVLILTHQGTKIVVNRHIHHPNTLLLLIHPGCLY